MSIKLLLADDHPIFVESLSMLLSTIEEIELVGTANNGLEVLKKLAYQEPVDIIVCDYMMPEMDGVQLTFRLKENYPHIKILMLTSREDTEGIRSAIQAGVKGFVSKKTNKAELQKAIMCLQMGLTYYSEEVMKILASKEFSSTEETAPVALTSREIDVLKLIAQELSGMQIADKLHISHHTVESHRKSLFRKIGVNSTYALIKYAMQHGIYPQN
ncbi:response regulator [Emticicia agri]|uniref:Response regulator transcription factor n=1 Tax=Emticicia agri TaxID=2492393 RepID=A0A4Q5M109_9BACT|nr:response regulator transcription factor [Emticicia agri]RYU95894.1 response regulator transcription factor [Emticicia agri]